MNGDARVSSEAVSEELMWALVQEHRSETRPALERLWSYYRNELDFEAGDEKRPYRAAQEEGLPWRLTRAPGEVSRWVETGGGRREVVVENDIAWRVHALVDFMFGKGVGIQSLAPDAERAALIERVLSAVLEHNGGVCFLQDLAVLAAASRLVETIDAALDRILGF